MGKQRKPARSKKLPPPFQLVDQIIAQHRQQENLPLSRRTCMCCTPVVVPAPPLNVLRAIGLPPQIPVDEPQVEKKPEPLKNLRLRGTSKVLTTRRIMAIQAFLKKTLKLPHTLGPVGSANWIQKMTQLLGDAQLQVSKADMMKWLAIPRFQPLVDQIGKIFQEPEGHRTCLCCVPVALEQPLPKLLNAVGLEHAVPPQVELEQNMAAQEKQELLPETVGAVDPLCSALKQVEMEDESEVEPAPPILIAEIKQEPMPDILSAMGLLRQQEEMEDDFDDPPPKLVCQVEQDNPMDISLNSWDITLDMAKACTSAVPLEYSLVPVLKQPIKQEVFQDLQEQPSLMDDLAEEERVPQGALRASSLSPEYCPDYMDSSSIDPLSLEAESEGQQVERRTSENSVVNELTEMNRVMKSLADKRVGESRDLEEARKWEILLHFFHITELLLSKM